MSSPLPSAAPRAAVRRAVFLGAAFALSACAPAGTPDSPTPDPFRLDRVVELDAAAERTANASLGDLDGDGDLDVVLAKGRHWPLANVVLLNDGRGGFTRRAFGEPDRTYTAALGDLDGDGDLDLVVGNDRPDPKRVYFGDGAGGFAPAGTFGDPDWPTRNVTLADLDADGRPDVIVANRGGPENRSQNYVCLNDGAGRFPGCTVLSGESATTIVAADLDDDRAVDLVVPHRDGGRSRIFLNDGGGRFGPDSPFGPAESATRAAAAGDLDGDGLPDLVMGDGIRGGVLVFRNDRGFGFADPLRLGDPEDDPYAIALADLDGDGATDVVVGNDGRPGLVLLNRDGGTRFDAVRFGDGEGAVYGLALGDVTGDGCPDVVAARSDARSRMYPGPCGPPATAAAAGRPGSPSPDLAIENVTVVDAVHGARPGRTVVVDGGRIVRIEPAGTPTGAAEVVDGTGRYLAPGLWDFHVHLTYDDRFTRAMPGLFLAHGVTSVRDTGGMLDEVLPVVEAMRAEGATAPRVFFAGPLLDGARVVYDGEDRPALGIANPDVATARRNVARLAEAGVDFVKIYEMVTPEVFRAIADEAEARGLPRDGHVPLSMLARDVGPRMSSLEHLRNIELDCAADAEARLAARRRVLSDPGGASGGELRSGLHRAHRLPAVAAYDPARCAEVIAALATTVQVPTLRLNGLGLRSPFDLPGWQAALARTPPEVARAWGADAADARGGAPARDTTFGAWSLFLVGEMHERGVPVAAGTDTPIGWAIPGFSLHSELEMLVRAGLTPREALYAATVQPAAYFGLEAEMGTVEEGRLADLVLLGANPLEDVSATRTVEAVVTRGELLTRDELRALTR